MASIIGGGARQLALAVTALLAGCAVGPDFEKPAAPAAVSTGIGAQVQKPLALVVVGGILLAPALILVILPVLIEMFSRRQPAVSEASAEQPAE